ncbi:MAG: RHS repeat-associated core domain-containing protein [Parabacteroides sp.]|nr:RHS repeat-associated core domain-containing protein [Parabacteroides sp.]
MIRRSMNSVSRLPIDVNNTSESSWKVGGLLMVNAGSGGVHFPAYDLNGNVMGLVNATNGIISAKYEYGPFGEVFCAVGDMAKVNPFQFSTKYTDSETDLVYYGYRYYSPALGRWLSRDPIEERGGLNLYAFVNNDPVNGYDVLCLKNYVIGYDDPQYEDDIGAGIWESWSASDEIQARLIQHLVLNGVGLTGYLEDAIALQRHYFEGSGNDYYIQLEKMLNESKSALINYKNELNEAQEFAESLQTGEHQITSSEVSVGRNYMYESLNWYLAIGGYKSWGKGSVCICNDEYIMEYLYKIHDRYNWDKNKKTRHISYIVTDNYMGKFHREGCAQEFSVSGSVKKTIRWKKGKRNNATEINGWHILRPW